MKKQKGKNMHKEGEFNHSIKMPDVYKSASKILKQFQNKEGSLKTLIYGGRYRRYGLLTALLTKVINNEASLKSAIAASKLLIEQPSFDPYLAQVLTAQLLGKGSVNGDAKPLVVFRDYQEQIKTAVEKDFVLADPKSEMPRYVRVNTLQGGMDLVHIQLEKDGFILEKYDANESYDDFLLRVKNLAEPYYLLDYHIPELLVFPPSTKFWNNVLYKKNVIVLQDKASCLPVHLSDIEERCSVIDACAAPGNKTSFMASKMNNKGKVIAAELVKKRFVILKRRVADFEATCVTSLHMDFTKMKPTQYRDVEYIFLDPTCSSSGTDVHRDVVSPGRIRKLASLQATMLKHALSFPSVKEVIYSTCSIYEEENEGVVSDVLKQFGKDFFLADLGTQLQGWKHFGKPEFEFGHKCLRTDTSIDRCAGFFVAKFVRKDESKSGKRKCEESHEPEESVNGENNNLEVQSSETPKKKRKNKKLRVAEDTTDDIEVEKVENGGTVDLQSDGIGEKKKKKSKKSEIDMEIGDIANTSATENALAVQDDLDESVDVGEKKKKKSKKSRKSEADIEIGDIANTSATENALAVQDDLDESIDGSEKKRKKSKKSRKSESGVL